MKGAITRWYKGDALLCRKYHSLMLLLCMLLLLTSTIQSWSWSSSHWDSSTTAGRCMLSKLTQLKSPRFASFHPSRNNEEYIHPRCMCISKTSNPLYHSHCTVMYEKRPRNLSVLSSRPTKPSPSFLALSSSPNKPVDDLLDGRNTVAIVGGQVLVILFAAMLALVLHVPNWGLGPGFSFDLISLWNGILMVIPLGLIAAVLELIEHRFSALVEVAKASQRSVLLLMGGTFKPAFSVLISLALALAAGTGEEMLFRGVLQSELTERLNPWAAIGISSLCFGLLHAVTPLYAIMAGIASIYFGMQYLISNNLAIPMVCHIVYDFFALFYAHWTVTRLSTTEKLALLE